MAQVAYQLQLSEHQGTVVYGFLKRVYAQARADERVAIEQVLAQMRILPYQDPLPRYPEIVQAVSMTVLGTLCSIKKAGLSRAMLHYLRHVIEWIAQARYDINTRVDRIREEVKHLDRAAREEAYSRIILSAVDPHLEKLQHMTDHYYATQGPPLAVSNAPGAACAARRQQLADACVESGMHLGRKALDWDEVDMLVGCFKEMLSHFKLAEALLKGQGELILATARETLARDALHPCVQGYITEVREQEKEYAQENLLSIRARA